MAVGISPDQLLVVVLFAGSSPLCQIPFAEGKSSSAAKSHSKNSQGGELTAHIKCHVCEIGVQQVRRYVRNHSITEEEALSDLVENVCSLRHAEGRWLATLDIKQKSGVDATASTSSEQQWPWNWVANLKAWWSGTTSTATQYRRVTAEDPLVVVKEDRPRECHSECNAVQKACKSWLTGKEEDLVKMLLKSEGVVAIRKRMCKKACGKRWDELPKLDGWTDEPFQPMEIKTSWSHKETLKFSPGDLEALAAREAYGKQKQDAQDL